MRLDGVPRALLTQAAFALLAAVMASAQSQEGSSPKAPVAAGGAPKTVVGCLTGYNGHYTLGTMSDTLYLLVGDSALFKHYNAMLVRATGTVSEPPPDPSRNNVLSQQPPTLTVSKLKKVADGCN
jgi:hypothetical protein